ncbi:uncharacterized protein [Paramormyrops kingsleyae]|uniref:uncharacterized protein isoform X2 n=1 Tax=Paramormyrops kingsleyae TaxID=1676925 RepID=UPI003B972596
MRLRPPDPSATSWWDWPRWAPAEIDGTRNRSNPEPAQTNQPLSVPVARLRKASCRACSPSALAEAWDHGPPDAAQIDVSMNLEIWRSWHTCPQLEMRDTNMLFNSSESHLLWSADWRKIFNLKQVCTHIYMYASFTTLKIVCRVCKLKHPFWCLKWTLANRSCAVCPELHADTGTRTRLPELCGEAANCTSPAKWQRRWSLTATLPVPLIRPNPLRSSTSMSLNMRFTLF